VSTYLQFAVLGLGLGAIYIGLANGLLLVYRATGIINFAQGAMAMWGVYVYAQLQIDGDLVLPAWRIPLGDPPGKPVSLVIGLVTALALGILVHYLVFRPVRHAPVLAQVVVSIGLMVFLQALVVIRFGPNSIDVDPLVPDSSFTIGGTTFSGRECVMTGIMILLSLLVWSYLRFTRAGVATRAAAENERAAILMGFSPDRLAGVAMVLGALVSTVAVAMGSELTGLNPANYTLLVVPALAVVLVARLESIGIAVVASILLGSFQSIIGLLVTKPWWPNWAQSGVDQVLPFAIVMVILFAYGTRLPARGTLQTIRLPDVSVPRIRPVPSVLLIGGAVIALSVTTGEYRFGITNSLIVAVLALSYVVITGYLGQISLAQSAFAGAAGFTMSKATTNWHVPFPLSILLCALVATALGMLVALPAFRIRGAQLAIVTIAAALAIERFIFSNYSLTPAEGNPIATPRLFGIDFGVRAGRNLSRLEFSLMVLAVTVVAVLLFVRLASGHTGRTFLAVRANERAAASAGIDVRVTKLIGFALSAFLAGVAGCLLGYSHGQLSAESFTVFVGLQILAVAYLGGITSFGGALVAGVLGPLGIVYTLLHDTFELGNYYPLISGLGLIITAILNPDGIAGETRRQIDWVSQRLPRRSHGHGPSSAEPVTPGTASTSRRETTRV
jgi:branched-chain amino acid transport system permease protein